MNTNLEQTCYTRPPRLFQIHLMIQISGHSASRWLKESTNWRGQTSLSIARASKQRVGCHDTMEAPCSCKIILDITEALDLSLFSLGPTAGLGISYEKNLALFKHTRCRRGRQQNLAGGSVFDLPNELCAIAPRSSGPIEIRCMPQYLCFNSCHKLPAFVVVCLRKCIMWMRNGRFGMDSLLKSFKANEALESLYP